MVQMLERGFSTPVAAGSASDVHRQFRQRAWYVSDMLRGIAHRRYHVDASGNRVDEPYFDTMRIPLLRGRAFRENDDAKAPLVAIVNQSMARQFWPNEDPIGKLRSIGARIETVPSLNPGGCGPNGQPLI